MLIDNPCSDTRDWCWDILSRRQSLTPRLTSTNSSRWRRIGWEAKPCLFSIYFNISLFPLFKSWVKGVWMWGWASCGDKIRQRWSPVTVAGAPALTACCDSLTSNKSPERDQRKRKRGRDSPAFFHRLLSVASWHYTGTVVVSDALVQLVFCRREQFDWKSGMD